MRLSGRSSSGIKGKGFCISEESGVPFFLQIGISCPEDIKSANKAYVAAGRYTRSGPQFFYDLPVAQAIRMMQAAGEQAKEEMRERRRSK